MRGWTKGLIAAVALCALPAVAHDTKRTDKCGCHHEWGLRHCHPNKRTPQCEAPAKDSEQPRQVEERDELPKPSDKAIRI